MAEDDLPKPWPRVPETPSEDMLIAGGLEILDALPDLSQREANACAAKVYAAMLAVRPPAPVAVLHPRLNAALSRHYEATIQFLENTGRLPTPAEIAEACGCTVEAETHHRRQLFEKRFLHRHGIPALD